MLWDSLIREWGLSEEEAQRIDRREGQSCTACGTHLRSMALSKAILDAVGSHGTLEDWVSGQPAVQLLEINRAGDLTAWLDRLPNHVLVEFPELDLHNLAFPDDAWDVVVHSDTLEHVDDPVVALRECLRVLRPAGALCFTIPIVPGRMTRRRDGLPPSYHGSEENQAYRVVTEYGADFWPTILDAGFGTLQLVADYWPDAIALMARRGGRPVS